ncbi:hypothetical protein Tco_0928581, partial [Tanacetum coccineum]
MGTPPRCVCVARLDVAMFNAILRESANEIPTGHVSDPITEFSGLPIPAGKISFGSGAELQRAIGTWSKWLNDRFSVDTNADNTANENNTSASEVKWFDHLNSLSHLLMVPKDMLTDKSIRADVCLLPSLSYHHKLGVGGAHSNLDSNGSSRDAFDIMPLNEDISKRKARDVQYEGDLQFVLSFMYVACMYETMVNEVNMRLSSLDGMSEKTIGVALEAAGGLYRKLAKNFLEK